MKELEEIARVCWEANRALQVRDGEEFPDDPWDAAPQYRRICVEAIVTSIRAGNNDPADGHRLWWSWMEANGWTYGPVKNPVQMQHPGLRAWELLTPRQQLAQRLNVHIVQEVMRSEEGRDSIAA